MPTEEDVVITGWGAITPLGLNSPDFYNSLLLGKSAVDEVIAIGEERSEIFAGAVITNFDAKQHVQPRKTIKVMCHEIQIAFAAAMQAAKAAGISSGTIEPSRIGTVFASEVIFSEMADVESVVRLCANDGHMNHSVWGATAMDHMYPLWMLKALPNMAACHVGIALDARGPNNTVTTEWTSSLNAIIEACNVIKRGRADVMLVGASSSRINPIRMLQRYKDDYAQAAVEINKTCRPYDADRAGTVPGEGAATVVLERRSSASARGARILATICSTSSVFQPSKAIRWSGSQKGAQRAIDSLLQKANKTPQAIDHINGNGNGVVIADLQESIGIAATAPNTPVVSYKGAIGDSIAAAGLLELIGSLEGMQNQQIAATTNLESKDPQCPVVTIARERKPRTADCFVKLSQTPQGHTAGVLIQSEIA